MFLIQLASMRIFVDSYSGIATLISLEIFLMGTVFFVNAKVFKVIEKE